jgi:hypothetical protein
MKPHILWRHSLKNRVTLLMLGIFVFSIWALSYYASRKLQVDMQRAMGERQFQAVSGAAAHVNEELTERLEALERVPEYAPSDEQTRNMEQIVKLLEASANPKWLELAELYRELGDMDAATRSLSHITGEQERLHSVIEKLVSLKVRGPVKFNY